MQSTVRCGGRTTLGKHTVRQFLVASRSQSGNSFVANANLANEKGDSGKESSGHHHHQDEADRNSNNMSATQYSEYTGDHLTSMNDYFRSNIKSNSYFDNLQYSMNKMLQAQEKQRVCVETTNNSTASTSTTNGWVKTAGSLNSDSEHVYSAATTVGESNNNNNNSNQNNNNSNNISSTGKDNGVENGKSSTANNGGSGSDQNGQFATPEMPRYYANQTINRSAQWQSTNLSKSINFFYNQAAVDAAASKVGMGFGCFEFLMFACLLYTAFGSSDPVDDSVLGQECRRKSSPSKLTLSSCHSNISIVPTPGREVPCTCRKSCLSASLIASQASGRCPS